MFNAPNSAIITGRNSSITLSSPNDPVTAQNLPYDANGNLIVRAIAAARRGLRRRDELPGAAERAGAGTVLVLTR